LLLAMTQPEIRALLETPYERERWRKLMTAIFPQRNFFATPTPIDIYRKNEQKLVKGITQLGDVQLADQNTIGFFEVELLPGVADLARNKMAIRKTVDAHVHVSGHVGALIS